MSQQPASGESSTSAACNLCGQPYPVRNGQVLKTIPRVTPVLDGAMGRAYYPALYECRKCRRPVPDPKQRPKSPSQTPATTASQPVTENRIGKGKSSKSKRKSRNRRPEGVET